MNRAIGATRERVFDNALHALRAHGTNNHFPAKLLADAQCFFERVAV
jgi:hypothetical protein